jgi:hypothetical protein
VHACLANRADAIANARGDGNDDNDDDDDDDDDNDDAKADDDDDNDDDEDNDVDVSTGGIASPSYNDASRRKNSSDAAAWVRRNVASGASA